MSNEDSFLLQLPEELLMMIITYIPNRLALSTTCKQIYGIVCLLERNCFTLAVTPENVRKHIINRRKISCDMIFF